MQKQVVSRQRVLDHGEVYTHTREVEAMLDLVKDESYRLDSKFLEPSCGHGNFLIAILKRKLANKLLLTSYDILTALSSIYAIELLKDNVKLARGRLYYIICKMGGQIDGFGKSELELAKEILRKNIVWGDALEMRCADDKRKSITFYEWRWDTQDSKMVASQPHSMRSNVNAYSQNTLPLGE